MNRKATPFAALLKPIQSIIIIVCLSFLIIYIYNNRTARNTHYGKVFQRLALECQGECDTNKRFYYFQKAVYYDPNLSDAYYQLAIMYGNQGRYEREIESYKKVTELDHRNHRAHFKIGLYHFLKGELEGALRYFLQSQRYQHDSHDTYYYMGRLYEQKGMYEEAVIRYRLLIVLGSAFTGEACRRMWHISKLPGQYDMVLSHVEKLKKSPRGELWEPIDRYLKTDQMPKFMKE